ncbi:DUF5810 domain-containing protein [Halococcus thailandensis]|uniref:Uncharacterized protein n=1 Tax=Halococcus thailandensis JCM 13552 TaxID=1227457 RepID=M0N0G2_9EURY|nr:DUF5810 domain-containing protein [Halococcus thailandensis]EMA50574.1 hypothetical protein C451_16445 [Halococcus thailandensis JCM 13552]
MGYACPVCETPQADARHLANHLAFTALLGDDDHESWLDEHAPGWEQSGEDELAKRVEEGAAEVEFPQVFEDTTGHDHHHDDEPRPGELFDEQPTRGPSNEGSLDAETAAAVEQARAMTEDTGDESETDDGTAASDGSSDDSDGDADENE